MIEINSAQELVDSLLNAGDRLVIVDFYSPGCGGCKALHPKVYTYFDLFMFLFILGLFSILALNIVLFILIKDSYD